MKLNDIIKETIYDAKTKKTEVIERKATQEDVDKYNEALSEQERQSIIKELNDLDKIISRVEEDLIAKVGLELYPSKQAILDRKKELRAKL